MAGARHPSTFLFYFVAAALGLAFSGVLLVLAWNNALENETRKFSFDAISVQNAVAANIRTAGAVVDSLAAFMAVGDPADNARFDEYTRATLGRYPFIDGMAYLELAAPGEVSIRHSSGTFPGEELLELMRIAGGERIVREVVMGESGAVPLAHDQPGADGTNALYLVQAVSAGAGPTTRMGLVVLVVDLAALIEARAIDPALNVALYTESEGVAGRRLVYSRTPATRREGIVIEPLGTDALVRLHQFSLRLITGKDLLWSEIDKGLVFVAGFLGMGVTLLLVALARAKELQARELRARNLVIEEQVRQQTRELAEARDQAVEASRVKSDFLASMSHEIRTPLNAIIGMAELLSETSLSGDQKKYVGVFRNAGEALLSLVNDILDLSKIEADQLTLEAIDFNLHEIVEQAVEMHALKADEKGVKLVADIEADVPSLARGDPGRLRQIILNLIGNAIKFTEQGEIVVRVRRVPSGDDGLSLHFEVRDSGIGIPASKLESIFASFTQVDSSTTRKYGGTGLGLTISKRLVEMMHGRIWVESTEGEGSTFQFDVRLGLAEGGHEAVAAPSRDVASAEPAPGAAPARASILLVEDNPDNRLLIKAYLKREPYRIVEAENGAEALEKFRASRFDLVLMDVQMPVMDGYSATRAIRDWEAEHRRPPTPVIALTANAIKEDRDRSRAAGCDDHLTKPIKKKTLIDALHTRLGSAA